MTPAATLIVILCSYFLPTIAACLNGHHNKLAVFFLNLLLGWTLLGWVGAFIWAFMKAPKPQHITIINSNNVGGDK